MIWKIWVPCDIQRFLLINRRRILWVRFLQRIGIGILFWQIICPKLQAKCSKLQTMCSNVLKYTAYNIRYTDSYGFKWHFWKGNNKTNKFEFNVCVTATTAVLALVIKLQNKTFLSFLFQNFSRTIFFDEIAFCVYYFWW